LLGGFVAFPGALLGLLASPLHASQNFPDVARVIGNPKNFGDCRRYSSASPEIGFVTRLPWPGSKNFQQPLFLFRVEMGLRAWVRFAFQRIYSALLHGPLPPLHRRDGSRNNLGDLADSPAFQQELSRKPTASLQLGCASVLSHIIQYA
jgi:hypothetical protein